MRASEGEGAKARGRERRGDGGPAGRVRRFGVRSGQIDVLSASLWLLDGEQAGGPAGAGRPVRRVQDRSRCPPGPVERWGEVI